MDNDHDPSVPFLRAASGGEMNDYQRRAALVKEIEYVILPPRADPKLDPHPERSESPSPEKRWHRFKYKDDGEWCDWHLHVETCVPWGHVDDPRYLNEWHAGPTPPSAAGEDTFCPTGYCCPYPGPHVPPCPRVLTPPPVAPAEERCGFVAGDGEVCQRKKVHQRHECLNTLTPFLHGHHIGCHPFTAPATAKEKS